MSSRFARPGPSALLACAALLALLALPGCGRRGPLEPPGGSAALAPGKRPELASTPTTLATRPGAVVLDAPESELDEEERPAISVSPSPTPRKRGRAYEVPKEPFILDPLL